MDKLNVLRTYFGHSNFRVGQSELIDNILFGRGVLGIMPTGAGKSLCYQVPALILDGLTLVVSPLISLMKDQVNALVQSGVKAAYINSSLSAKEYFTVLQNAINNEYKILYVAPERLDSKDFLELANPYTITTGFDRENLSFTVLKPQDKFKQLLQCN